MKNIRLEELATWIHAEYKGQGNISGIKVDARLIEPGDVFRRTRLCKGCPP